MSTFGNTSAGGSSTAMSSNYKRGSRFSCPTSGALLSKVTARISGGSTATQKVKAVIYSDSGGWPGTKLAESGEVVIAVGAAAAWVDFTLSVTLAAGQYWLVLHTGTTDAQARYHYSSSWSTYIVGKSDSYSDGATTSWGSAGWYSSDLDYGRMSIYATYSTVDTTAPEATLTAPVNGATLVGTTALTVTASDNVGVAGVQFKVDGANVGAEDTSSPFSYSWDSTTVEDGSHTVSAVARDAAGNTTATATVTVTVKNRVDSDGPLAEVAAVIAGGV